MSSHPWCSDVSRDEAIRAAEDAAAAERTPPPDHRDPPAAVAELRERVAKIEEAMVSGSTWFPKSDQPAPPPPPAPPQITKGDTLATVRDGGGRPMPKGPPPGLRAEKREATPASRDGVSADGLRKERVTLEVTIRDGRQFGVQLDGVCGVVADYIGISRKRGESVRVAEEATIGSGDVFLDVGCGSTGDEIVRLTAERDAAIRERDAALARVAVLRAAPAANAGGEANYPAAPDSSQEPVAWGVRFPAGNVVPFKDRELAEAKTKEANDRAMAAVGISDAVKCVPLYAAPHPPRGWLTEEERKAVEAAVAVVDQRGRTNIGVALTALLARSTPPRVRRPRPKVIPGGTVMELIDHINEAWIAAIREAGGEVGE